MNPIRCYSFQSHLWNYSPITIFNAKFCNRKGYKTLRLIQDENFLWWLLFCVHNILKINFTNMKESVLYANHISFFVIKSRRYAYFMSMFAFFHSFKHSTSKILYRSFINVLEENISRCPRTAFVDKSRSRLSRLCNSLQGYIFRCSSVTASAIFWSIWTLSSSNLIDINEHRISVHIFKTLIIRFSSSTILRISHIYKTL